MPDGLEKDDAGGHRDVERIGEPGLGDRDAFGGVGLRATKPSEVDDVIKEMIKVKKPVIFDCRVANLTNCFPMIPSGKAHNEMILGSDAGSGTHAITGAGQALV